MPDIRSDLPRRGYGNRGSTVAVPLIFFLVGLAILGVVLFAEAQSIKARWSWKPVPATILESSVQPHHKHVGESTSSYDAAVNYRYRWAGSAHESSDIGASFLPSHSYPYKGMAEDWVRAHPVGSVQTALVDPDDADQATLDPSLTIVDTTCLFFPLPFVLLGSLPLLDLVAPLKSLSKGRILFIFAVVWGGVALGIHLAAGSVTQPSWLAFLGYFLLVAVIGCRGIYLTQVQRGSAI